MMRCCLIAISLIFSVALAAADTPTIAIDKAVTDLLSEGAHLYRAGDQPLMPPQDPQQFLASMPRVDKIRDTGGGQYWLYARLRNNSAYSRFAFSAENSLIDTVQAYFYEADRVYSRTTGYLHSHSHSLHYGEDFEFAPDQQIELLVYIDSRMFSGLPRFIVSEDGFYNQRVASSNAWLVACFGAIAVLALYNFFIGARMGDRSYYYYALYLVFGLIGWFANFNVLGEWFGAYSYSFMMLPMFLSIAFSCLYIIHFLELPGYSPVLSKAVYGLAIWSGWMALCYLFLPPSSFYLLHSLTLIVWLSLGLYCGVLRLRTGYKFARFYVAAFAVMSFGAVQHLVAALGLSDNSAHHQLFTVIAQALDGLLLSLALADRIDILRQQKDDAMRQAYQLEQWSSSLERDANTKLQEALAISEQESQKKSDFLRMVSHELRTPLHSIVSSAEQWPAAQDERSQRQLVEYISYGAARLRTQIDNLVLIAETEGGNLEASNHEFELRPLLDRLTRSVQGLLHKNVEFNLSCAENLPVAFVGDAYLLEHLLRTVLENACKYTDFGHVSLLLDWDGVRNTLDVELSDSGCGMNSEQLRTVFDYFVQISRGLDRESEGLGLGLTVCYRLSEILNADLKLDSEPGIGTEVHLSIPLQPLPGGIKLVAENQVDFAAGRVLIVEDNIINSQVLERMVAQHGCEVDVVHSGQQAIEILNNKSYSLILMDIQMPVMDGITATRWIRRRGINTPIVAVTANSDADVRRSCREKGMNDFLVKPVGMADIQRLLERQLAPLR